MKPRQRPWKSFLFGLLAVLLLAICLIPWMIGDTSRFGDRVAERLAAWTGGEVKFTGPVKVSFFPDISIRGPVELTNSARMPLLKSVTVQTAKVSLDLVDLLRGRITVDVLRLQKPNIKLKDGLLDAQPPPQALIANLLAGAPMRVLHVREGRIKLSSGLIENINAHFDAGEETGALTGVGSFSYKDVTMRYALESRAPKAEGNAEAIPFTLTLAAKPVKAKINGTASFAETFALDGQMQMKTDNLRKFLRWIGFALPEGESLKAFNLAGTFHLSGQTLSLEDGIFNLDGNKAEGALAVTTTSSSPRVEGTFAFERLVFDPYLRHGAASQAASGAVETGQGSPFDGALLEYVDADLRISAAQIEAGPLKFGKGGFTVTAKGGSVTSEIGELEFCGGTVNGRVNLELVPPKKQLGLVADFVDLSIEPCLKPLGLAVPVQGTGTLHTELATEGNRRAELTGNLGGSFKLKARDGTVPVDFARLISNPPPLEANGWNGDAGTAFNTLDADCRLSAGRISCQTVDMQTPRESVVGSGDVDLPRLTLDWTLSVAKQSAPERVLPPPGEDQPKISIRGSLAQPLIRRTDRSTLGEGSVQTGPLEHRILPH